ncbi:uncharacterized protein LOC124127201 isoform X2 [Haliotis rufescens]|uniref:uncharacterized protein LOC124127201 isoform X2 n=1 Tax=Haliotis rufescens TaxID=6454 RepID=UPI00201F89EF|nr:uncharacterized protein LOC124127201 isoform X2 [Haliotis rufescens]
MRVQSKYILACVVMSVILQTATSHKDVRNSDDSKLNRNKRAFGSLLKIGSQLLGPILSGPVDAFGNFLSSIFGLGGRESARDAEELRKQMELEKEKMTKEEHKRAEMVLALLQANMDKTNGGTRQMSSSGAWLAAPAMILVF